MYKLLPIALLLLTTCNLLPSPPSSVAVAVCKPAVPGDAYTDDGINTRTGCMLVTMTLGTVSAAADLTLPVALIHSEGNAPPTDLYPKAVYGRGNWLSVDEYVTVENDTPGGRFYRLHTPHGNVDYDWPVMIPQPLLPGEVTKSDLEKKSDLQVPLRSGTYRTRPFDGTFLTPIRSYQYFNGAIITYGNPRDSRSIRKFYQGRGFPDSSPGRPWMLTKISKSSIYRGPANEIRIERDYETTPGVVTFESSLYENAAINPLVVRGGQIRTDGKPGFAVTALATLLHKWTSTVTANANADGDVEQLVSSGRNDKEVSLTSFTYDPTKTAGVTVFKTILEQEGIPPTDLRSIKSIAITGRAASDSATWPYAVTGMTDTTIPNVARTSLVKECPHKDNSWGWVGQTPRDTYFTFVFPDGTTSAWEYARDENRSVLVRTSDVFEKQTWYNYNDPRGGGAPPTNADTGFELSSVYATDKDSSGPPLYFKYRYDIFSARTYHLPLVGKISHPITSGDRVVYYRALYGNYDDNWQMPKRNNQSFDVPWGIAIPDGRTRWEYRGLDGFTYETWDEDLFMTWYRWVDQNQLGDGTYDEEPIETYVMGTLQSRTYRDRFGRLEKRIDFDGAKQVTTTYHITPEGFTDRVDDDGTGESFVVSAWNPSRSGVTQASLTRNKQTVASFNVNLDNFGNADGAGTVTLGPVMLTTNTSRVTAGLLQKTSVTGPNGQQLSAELGYAGGDYTPTSKKINGQPVHTVTPKALTAAGDCK